MSLIEKLIGGALPADVMEQAKALQQSIMNIASRLEAIEKRQTEQAAHLARIAKHLVNVEEKNALTRTQVSASHEVLAKRFPGIHRENSETET